MIKNKLRWLLHFDSINKIWQIVNMFYMYGHKGFTAIKAFIYYLKWYITHKKYTYNQFSNVQNIKPFRPLHWKHEVKYFTGQINEKKVFIKTGGITNTSEREAYAITYIKRNSDVLSKHIPNICEATHDYLVEELIKGKPLSVSDDYVIQLFDIYKELVRLNVYHLDIRPENFIVKSDGSLVLIDFGYALVGTTDIYSMVDKNTKVKKIMKDIGSNYSPKNGTIDDAYSMLLTMKYVCPSLLKEYPEIWKEVNKDIGQRAVILE